MKEQMLQQLLVITVFIGSAVRWVANQLALRPDLWQLLLLLLRETGQDDGVTFVVKVERSKSAAISSRSKVGGGGA